MKNVAVRIYFFAFVLLHLSCSEIVVKVARKGGPRSSAINAAPASQGDQPRVQDFEYYLFHLDELRNDTSDEIYRRLKDNYRHVFRREFRNFRQILMGLATRKHDYQEGLTGSIVADECRAIEETDFKTFEGQAFLENLLEVSFLANLHLDDAKKLNPGLADGLDVVVHLILFELGMRARGESTVSLDNGITTIESTIFWKVDAEIPDPPELTEMDDYGMQLRFIRRFHVGSPVSFALEMTFAPGLYDKPETKPEYRVYLEHQWNDQELQGEKLQIKLQIWHLEEMTYSRRLTVEQAARFSQEYLFRDTIRYTLEGEEERKAILDFAELKKCAFDNVKMIVPGVLGMKKADAEELLTTLQFKIGEVIDQSNQDEDAVVIRQEPVPGAKVPPETEINLVLGFWSDLQEEMIKDEGIANSGPLPDGEEAGLPDEGTSSEPGANDVAASEIKAGQKPKKIR